MEKFRLKKGRNFVKLFFSFPKSTCAFAKNCQKLCLSVESILSFKLIIYIIKKKLSILY